jgi:SAM-dependent methyltransferase
MDIRTLISNTYLRGSGLEIGALHNPYPVTPEARVTYVDRLTVPQLREQYPELADKELIDVGIVDDGETLSTVPDGSQDFVIACHMLEHCQDPIRAFTNMLRVLREDGVLYLSVPDRRYTFDIFRPSTPLSHIIQDHEDGPEKSRVGHYDEYVTLVNRLGSEDLKKKQVDKLLRTGFSIHYHAWTQFDIFELLVMLERVRGLPFHCEALFRGDIDLHVVARKSTLLHHADTLATLTRKVEFQPNTEEQQYELKLKLARGFAAISHNWPAARLFQEAIRLFPERSAPYAEAVGCCVKLKNVDGARLLLEQGLAADPGDPKLLKIRDIIDAQIAELLKQEPEAKKNGATP